MKKALLTYFLLTISCTLSAQTTELWAGIRWGNWGVGEGMFFKTDGNGNCPQHTYSFTDSLSGYGSYGGLVAASNGMLYGTSIDGGLYNNGVIFEINPVTGVYTKKWDFQSASTGDFANGNLLQASNGKLYGLTQNGGTSNNGVLFEYDIALDTCIARVHFDGANLGSIPTNYLIEATNGKLYGSAKLGGSSNYGALFEYDPATNVFAKLYDFDGVSGRRHPNALLQASNGKFYGYTSSFSATGMLFSFDLGTGVLTKHLDLTDSTGFDGDGGLIEAPNGKLYGVTRYGGDSVVSGGSIFEFDTTSNSITRVVNVGALGYNTYNAHGTLFLASNNKMYGSSDYMDYFEYDYVNNIFTSKINTDSAWGGSEPRNMRFVEITRNNSEYIWPGDCNRDGVADHVDFLSVGLAYIDSGVTRTCASLDWIAQAGDNWPDTLPGGLNAHNADANGDGLVYADDSLAIQLNFGLTHALRPSNSLNTLTDFHLVPDHLTVLPGDTVRYDLVLTSGIPVDSLYGIAFTLSFDSSLAEPITGAMQYGASALGTIGTDLISMEKDFYPAGLIHAAVTRTDHTNATALTGSLGTFTLVVPSGITAPNVALVVTPQNIVGVTVSGTPIGFNALADTLHINAPSGVNQPMLEKDLALYPNPSSDRLTIRMKNDVIQYIELVDASGRRMYASAPSGREITIETATFAEGIYSVSVTTARGVIHQKLIVSHR